MGHIIYCLTFKSMIYDRDGQPDTQRGILTGVSLTCNHKCTLNIAQKKKIFIYATEQAR